MRGKARHAMLEINRPDESEDDHFKELSIDEIRQLTLNELSSKKSRYQEMRMENTQAVIKEIEKVILVEAEQGKYDAQVLIESDCDEKYITEFFLKQGYKIKMRMHKIDHYMYFHMRILVRVSWK